jgi:hypothetical protein
MVDVAPRQVVGTRQVVELVAEDAVAGRGREMEGEAQRGERAEPGEVAPCCPRRYFAFFFAGDFAAGTGAGVGAGASGGLISSSSTSKVSAAPGRIAGGDPRSP